MQPLATGAKLAAYHARLLSSHDFRVFIDVLNLDEVMTGSATFIDGQVNLEPHPGPVRRKATLTLSDPDGALDFSNASAWSGTSIWVDRLVRVRHVIQVPGHGEMTAVPFIGPPTALARNGAEVQVECSDKAALAMTGARPYTAAKGTNAVQAIRNILTLCTGEFRFRLPSSTRRLSKNYVVGLSAEASPILVAQAIAWTELGMRLHYSCDGYAMARVVPGGPVASLGWVTEVANASVDFTALANFVQVTGGEVSKKVGVNTVKTRAISTATVASSSPISPERLKRKGVTRYLPLVVGEDAYRKTTQTAARAKTELARASKVQDDVGASTIPMFHLDSDDLVYVNTTATGNQTLRLETASIPLGVGGDMTIGHTLWVSKVAAPRVASRIARAIVRPKPKPKAKKRRRRRKRRG
jgi:hypothetical protein